MTSRMSYIHLPSRPSVTAREKPVRTVRGRTFVSPLPLLTSEGAGIGAGARPRAPGETRASRSCFVTGKGPAALPSRPPLRPVTAPTWSRQPPQPAPPPLTCRMLLVSETANSSFSLGVFTVTLMIRGSEAPAEWPVGEPGEPPAGPSALSDIAVCGRGEAEQGRAGADRTERGPGRRLPAAPAERSPRARDTGNGSARPPRAVMTQRNGEVTRKGHRPCARPGARAPAALRVPARTRPEPRDSGGACPPLRLRAGTFLPSGYPLVRTGVCPVLGSSVRKERDG